MIKYYKSNEFSKKILTSNYLLKQDTKTKKFYVYYDYTKRWLLCNEPAYTQKAGSKYFIDTLEFHTLQTNPIDHIKVMGGIVQLSTPCDQTLKINYCLHHIEPITKADVFLELL